MIHTSTKKNSNLRNSLLPTVDLRDIYERLLSINETDEKWSIFYNEIKRATHGRIPNEKGNF